MRGGRGTIRAALAVSGTALLCMSTAACGSGSHSVPLSTSASAKTSTSTTTSARPTASSCAAPSGTEIIAVDGITTVDGDFAVTGYVQKLLCGPGVADDVEYENTGTHRSFVLPGTVKVELLGTPPTEQHASTLAVLKFLLQAQFATPVAQATPDGSMLWSNKFALSLDANGRITEITSLYVP